MDLSSILLTSSAAAAVGMLGGELALRRSNPWRLASQAFDEASVMMPHPARGWMQRPEHTFDFHHRYLDARNRVRFNRLGIHDAEEHAADKRPGVFRILLMGGTISAGWELPPSQTMAARLRQRLAERCPDREFEVIDGSVRLYATGQLAQFYTETFADFRPDLVIYLFNLNHPRRTISAHESGKSPQLSQPVYRLDGGGAIERLEVAPARHRNDMIYLDDDGEICRVPGRTSWSPWKRLCDRSHLAAALDELRIGDLRIRNFGDRKEIKNLEHQKFRRGAPERIEDLPYHWRITAALLHAWTAAVRAHGGEMIVVSNLAYYYVRDGGLHADRPKHPFGFVFDDIPERRYLPFIAETAGFAYLDSYEQARRQRDIRLDDLYTHPRYAYPNAAGADYHAALMASAIPHGGASDRDGRHGPARPSHATRNGR